MVSLIRTVLKKSNKWDQSRVGSWPASGIVVMMLWLFLCVNSTDRLLYVWDADAKHHHGNVGVLRWRWAGAALLQPPLLLLLLLLYVIGWLLVCWSGVGWIGVRGVSGVPLPDLSVPGGSSSQFTWLPVSLTPAPPWQASSPDLLPIICSPLSILTLLPPRFSSPLVHQSLLYLVAKESLWSAVIPTSAAKFLLSIWLVSLLNLDCKTFKEFGKIT